MDESHSPKQIGQVIESSLFKSYPPFVLNIRLSPFWIALLFGAAVVVLDVCGALAFGTFSNTPNVLDLTEDLSFIIAIVAFPLIIYYYLLFPKMVRKTFDALDREKIFQASKVKVNAKLLRLSEKNWVRSIPVILVTVVVIIVTIEAYFNIDKVSHWSEINPFFWIACMVLNTLGWLALASLMVNLILTILLVRNIFLHNDIEVYPLHQDGSGGFGALARFSLRLSYLALIIAAFIIAQAIGAIRRESLTAEYFIPMNSIAYLVIVPALFYLPLHQAHRAMLAYRTDLVSRISLQYRERHKALLAELPQNADVLANQLKYLEELEKLQEHNRKYPVWPFNAKVRMAVLANAFTPLVPTVIGLVFENFA